MLGEVEVVLSPGEEGALGGHGDFSRARPSGARSPYCGGGGEQRRVIEEEDVAGALVDAAVRGVAWRRQAHAWRRSGAGRVLPRNVLRFTEELLRGARRRRRPWLLIRLVDGATEEEVWQRHGAWRRSDGAASGMLLWLWSGSAKP